MKSKKILLSLVLIIFSLILFSNHSVTSRADMADDLNSSDASVTEPFEYFDKANQLVSDVGDESNNIYFKEINENCTTTRITNVQKEDITNFDDLSNKELIVNRFTSLLYDEARGYVYSDDDLTNKSIDLNNVYNLTGLVHIDRNYMLHVTRSDGVTTNYYHVASINNNEDFTNVSGWVDSGILMPIINRQQISTDYQFMSKIVSDLPAEYQTKYQQALDQANETREKNDTVDNAEAEYKVFSNIDEFLYEQGGSSNESGGYKDDLNCLLNIVNTSDFKSIFINGSLIANKTGEGLIGNDMKDDIVNNLNKQIVQNGMKVPMPLEAAALGLAISRHFDYENDYVNRAYTRWDANNLKTDEIDLLFAENKDFEDAKDGLDLYNGLTGEITDEIADTLSDSTIGTFMYENYETFVSDSQGLNVQNFSDSVEFTEEEDIYNKYINY